MIEDVIPLWRFHRRPSPVSSRSAIRPHAASVAFRSTATFDPDFLMDSTPARFGSDHGTLRSEDEPLLTGKGRFTDDLNAPEQAYAVFVRATVEPRGDPQRGCVARRARCRACSASSPAATSQTTASARSLRSRSFPAATASRCSPPRCRRSRSIASAMSARRSRSWWRRRWRRRSTPSEQVTIDLEELASAPDVLSATADGAVAIHEARPGNIALDWTDGNAAPDRSSLRGRGPRRARAARRHAPCAGLARAALRHRDVGRGEAEATR